MRTMLDLSVCFLIYVIAYIFMVQVQPTLCQRSCDACKHPNLVSSHLEELRRVPNCRFNKVSPVFQRYAPGLALFFLDFICLMTLSGFISYLAFLVYRNLFVCMTAHQLIQHTWTQNSGIVKMRQAYQLKTYQILMVEVSNITLFSFHFQKIPLLLAQTAVH